MPGFRSNSTDDVVYAKNIDLSGSSSPANTITQDGQILIGTTTPNANGSHCNIVTVTAGANMTITQSAGALTFASSGGGGGGITGTTTQYDVIVGAGVNTVGSVGPGTAGQVLQSGGAAANPAYSTSTYPSTNATGDLIYGTGTNALSTLSVPTNIWQVGTQLEYNGILPNYFDFAGEILMRDDWISSGAAGTLNWSLSSGGGGTYALNQVSSPNNIGTVSLLTGTGPGANSSVNLSSSTLAFSGGRFIWTMIAKLSTIGGSGTAEFLTNFGFCNQYFTSAPANCVVFSYDFTINSGKWQLISSTGNSQTTVNTSSTPDTNWHKYTIDINAAGTLATFYIDGISIGTITTNIPTSSSNLCTPFITIYNSGSGVTNSALYVDAFQLYIKLTTPR